jgi:hypothetical protein
MSFQFHKAMPNAKTTLLAGVLAGAVFVSSAAAQTPAGGTSSGAAANPAAGGAPGRFPSRRLPRQASLYYEGAWGVDSLTVKLAESGELIRFSYRILDSEKAATLNDKKNQPSLIDQQAGVSLVIPEVQNVGLLRQTATPEAGKSYWMTFSNKGRPVKRGDRVSVVIGHFRADGLVVE